MLSESTEEFLPRQVQRATTVRSHTRRTGTDPAGLVREIGPQGISHNVELHLVRRRISLQPTRSNQLESLAPH